ncbi:MAG: glycosyltransferase family 2 protein [Bdellovibrionales bacterium]|nr:glycosyltransferase family 2 protein [Bdellovibrionales bacterium]
MISVIVPVYNEAENIVDLASELSRELQPLSHEIRFVDDGSTDASWERILEAQKKIPHIHATRLAKNLGKSAAWSVGFQEAQGSVICTLDADLQNDPRDIHPLLKKLDEGYDLVSGLRSTRSETWYRIGLSRLGNAFIQFVTGSTLNDHGCGLKVVRKEFCHNLNLCQGMHRFLSVILIRRGARAAELEIRDRKRRHGKSKFGMERIFQLPLEWIRLERKFPK